MPPSEYPIIQGLVIERPGSGDRAGAESILEETIRELETAEPASQDASRCYDILSQSIREHEDKLARAKVQLQETATGLDESLDNPAADIRALALQRHPLECEVAFLQDAVDRGKYIRLPAARENKLRKALHLRRLEAVEAALHACLSHIDTQERLERSGVFETEKRLCVVGERTVNLRAAAKEAHRQAQIAEVELNDEVKRHLAATQTRAATGTVTRAETMFAIPALQGHAVTQQ
jgi:hypothetical protein